MTYVNMFVIERDSAGEKQYWACSSEHGCGWHPGHPKQSFSRSELTREIRSLIDLGQLRDLVIRQLAIEELDRPPSRAGGKDVIVAHPGWKPTSTRKWS